METVTITLPLPPRELSPNWTVGSRGGRFAKSRRTRAYRQAACFVAMEAQGSARPFNWAEATVQARFYFRDARRRDKDNANASLKAAWDGIADAGVVVNDAGLTHLPPVMGVDGKEPRVEIVIARAEPRAAANAEVGTRNAEIGAGT